MKACPFCAEDIQDAAIVCKHCGRDLTGSTAGAVRQVRAPRRGRRAILIGIGVCSVLGLAGLVSVVMLAALLETARRSESSTDRLVVLVYTGQKGIRITNDTDRVWDNCEASLTGDYSAAISILRARQSVEIFYTEFRAGATQLNEADGYARAIRSTAFSCSGDDNRRHTAFVR